MAATNHHGDIGPENCLYFNNGGMCSCLRRRGILLEVVKRPPFDRSEDGGRWSESTRPQRAESIFSQKLDLSVVQMSNRAQIRDATGARYPGDGSLQYPRLITGSESHFHGPADSPIASLGQSRLSDAGNTTCQEIDSHFTRHRHTGLTQKPLPKNDVVARSPVRTH